MQDFIKDSFGESKKLVILFMLSGINLDAQSHNTEDQSINSNVKEIIVIFKTHYDIGYTNRVQDVLQ